MHTHASTITHKIGDDSEVTYDRVIVLKHCPLPVTLYSNTFFFHSPKDAQTRKRTPTILYLIRLSVCVWVGLWNKLQCEQLQLGWTALQANVALYRYRSLSVAANDILNSTAGRSRHCAVSSRYEKAGIAVIPFQPRKTTHGYFKDTN